jgi:antitoxin component of MazEF toxin-antitoxin module
VRVPRGIAEDVGLKPEDSLEVEVVEAAAI